MYYKNSRQTLESDHHPAQTEIQQTRTKPPAGPAARELRNTRTTGKASEGDCGTLPDRYAARVWRQAFWNNAFETRGLTFCLLIRARAYPVRFNPSIAKWRFEKRQNYSQSRVFAPVEHCLDVLHVLSCRISNTSSLVAE